MNKKTIVFVMIALLVGICVPMPGNNPGFIPIVSAGGDCPTTEAELEADLTDVSDVYTNNDFADNSANWNTAFGWGNHALEGYLKTPVSFIDYVEIATPAVPAANTLRLFVEDFHGFSFYKFLDNTSMKRALVRDSVILVKNVRGTTILANRIVYATGSENDVPTVDYAKANNIDTMPSIGVTIEEITNDSYGRVMQVGLLENIDTSTLNPGDVLYVSDVVAGLPRVTLPPTPSLIQEIGTVLVSDAVNGSIQIVARSIDGNEYGTINDFTIVKNCTASAFFGDGGNLTNITADGDGFAGWVGHPHNQDLNSTSTNVAFGGLNIDSNTLYVDYTNDEVGIGTSSPDYKLEVTDSGPIGIEVESSDNNAYFIADGANTKSSIFYMQEAGVAKYGFFYSGSANYFRIGHKTASWTYPFEIEDGTTQAYQLHLDSSGYVGIADGSPSKRLELPSTASNDGRGNANRWDTYCDKRIKEDFSKLPKDETLLLCRIIDWRIYKPIEHYVDENGTYHFGETLDDFCVGVYAQALYWDIINAFGNNTRAYKIANQIIDVPEDEEKQLWTISETTILMIYARAWQIIDGETQENREHIIALETWASNFGYNPPPWD